MRKYFSLTKTLIKSGFALEDGKGHKIYRILLYLILLISLLPTLGGIYFLIDAALPLYTQIDQTSSLMGSILFLVCSTTFIFSLFIIPSVFYFSNDIDLLLALPLKGEHIIAAKFTVCVIYEYMFAVDTRDCGLYSYMRIFTFPLFIRIADCTADTDISAYDINRSDNIDYALYAVFQKQGSLSFHLRYYIDRSRDFVINNDEFYASR